jgi:hypothetical protein
MNESDIARRVVDWLTVQHWDVYQEVQLRAYDKIADIVAVRCGLVWVIECKQALTFKVLEQAANWHAHFRSVAVKRSLETNRALAVRIAHDYLSLGVLEVDAVGVTELVSPPLMRAYHGVAKYIAGGLTISHKTHAQAGSCDGGHYTPYRATMDTVREFIAQHDGCTLKEIMVYMAQERFPHHYRHHYNSTQTARSAIRRALETWERDWCEVSSEGRDRTYHIRAHDTPPG